MSNRSVIPASFSSIEAYNTCPKRFYHTKIAKDVVEEVSEAMAWGNEVHKALEERGKYSKPLTPRFAKYEMVATKIERAPGEKFYEYKTAVNAQFQKTEFFADDCYVRGVEDVLIVNGTKFVTSDHKSGKKKPKSRQLILSALRVFASFPDVQEGWSVFNWLACDPVEYTIAHYTRDQVEVLWQPFVQDIAQMQWSEQHDVWPAKPSGLCRDWCPVHSCPHNGKYRR